MPEIYEVTATGSPSTITEYVDGTAVTQTTATGLSVIGSLNAATINSAGTINLTPSSGLQINGSAGTANYVLTSQGASLPPIWAAAPGASSGYATGVRQIVTSFIQSVATGTTILPADNTIPQNTEGTQFISATITPQSSTSSLIIIATLGAITPSVISTMTSALFRDSAVGAFAAGAIGVSSTVTTAHTLAAVLPSTAAVATTIKLRAGMNVAGTLYVNGYAGPSTYYGGVCQSGITIIEVGV